MHEKMSADSRNDEYHVTLFPATPASSAPSLRVHSNICPIESGRINERSGKSWTYLECQSRDRPPSRTAARVNPCAHSITHSVGLWARTSEQIKPKTRCMAHVSLPPNVVCSGVSRELAGCKAEVYLCIYAYQREIP